MIKEVRRQYKPAVLNVHISWCVDVSNDVSLSDSVGRSCRRLSVGESCRVSSDGVRDSAGYGHRSILDQPCSAQRDVTHTHETNGTTQCTMLTRRIFIATARQQIVALPGIPGGLMRLLAASIALQRLGKKAD